LLDHLRVLDLTDDEAMIAGQILGDLGADVVLVEPPDGARARHRGRVAPPGADSESTPDHERRIGFWAYNRNKRSVVIDFDEAEGRRTFQELVADADIVLDSQPIGRLDSLDLGPKASSAINPGLIWVSISPFGTTGPKSRWASSDLVALAASGVLDLTGDPDRAPVRVAVPQSGLHAGAEAAVGALIALAERRRSGRGQHVDVSAQTAAMVATQNMILSRGWNGATVHRAGGAIDFGDLKMQLIHPAADGHVSVMMRWGRQTAPFAERLVEVMAERGFVPTSETDRDWVTYGEKLTDGSEPMSGLVGLYEALSAFTSAHTKQELSHLATERGLLVGPVATSADVFESRQLAARGFWRATDSPGVAEPARHPGPFAALSGTPITYRTGPPRLGAHDDAVRSQPRRQGQNQPRRQGQNQPRRQGQNQPRRAQLDAPVPPKAGEPTPSPAGERSGPLAGVKVLDFMWVMAGPASLRYLTDYGATVVHVENPARPCGMRMTYPYWDNELDYDQSGAYANLQSDKLALSLNLKVPESRAVVEKLVAWADVVTENYAPGAMARLDLDYENLAAINPGVIMVSSSLNGQTGPDASLAGFGTMAAAATGFTEITGWSDRTPAGPFAAYTDYVAPRFTAAAILAALDHRARTGEGQYIDVSQAESSLHFLTPALLAQDTMGITETRSGNASPDWAPHGVYPATGQDRWVAIAVETDEQWQALHRVTGIGESGRHDRVNARLEDRDLLDEQLGVWTAQRSVEELEASLQGAHIPCHRVANSADAFADAQLAHRGHFVEVDHPTIGRVPIEGSRMIFSETPSRPGRGGLLYGEHNQEILSDIVGLTADEIAKFEASGALA